MPSGPGIQPAFSAEKTGTNQTVNPSTETKVTYEAERFDTNNDFDLANNRFTPTVPGKYYLTTAMIWLSTDDEAALQVIFFRNGLVFKEHFIRASGTASQGLTYSALIDANGSTDFFEVFVQHNAATSKQISGNPAHTWFMAQRVGP